MVDISFIFFDLQQIIVTITQILIPTSTMRMTGTDTPMMIAKGGVDNVALMVPEIIITR